MQCALEDVLALGPGVRLQSTPEHVLASARLCCTAVTQHNLAEMILLAACTPAGVARGRRQSLSASRKDASEFVMRAVVVPGRVGVGSNHHATIRRHIRQSDRSQRQLAVRCHRNERVFAVGALRAPRWVAVQQDVSADRLLST